MRKSKSELMYNASSEGVVQSYSKMSLALEDFPEFWYVEFWGLTGIKILSVSLSMAMSICHLNLVGQWSSEK